MAQEQLLDYLSPLRLSILCKYNIGFLVADEILDMTYTMCTAPLPTVSYTPVPKNRGPVVLVVDAHPTDTIKTSLLL